MHFSINFGLHVTRKLTFYYCRVSTVQTDEYGVEETVTVVQPAPLNKYSKNDVFVPPVLAKWLRPHQREGVHFMYQCVMGLKDFAGNGCILADDMGTRHDELLLNGLWTLTHLAVQNRSRKDSPVCYLAIYAPQDWNQCQR